VATPEETERVSEAEGAVQVLRGLLRQSKPMMRFRLAGRVKLAEGELLQARHSAGTEVTIAAKVGGVAKRWDEIRPLGEERQVGTPRNYA
jgi:hypothetical protein